MAQRVGVNGLLRGAAMMSRVPAGFTDGTAADSKLLSVPGIHLPVDRLASLGWPRQHVGDNVDSWVWIERTGEAHANDEMVLERLALSIDITRQRTRGVQSRNPIEVLIDDGATRKQRLSAAARLGLKASQTAVIVASPDLAGDDPSSVVVTTAYGRIRAWLNPTTIPDRAGVAPGVPVTELSSSWVSAITTLRLTSEVQPVLFADDLGPILLLAQVGEAPEELQALDGAIASAPWLIATIDALVASDSVRAAAAVLHVHHSTLQARTAELSKLLGFDVRTAFGRHRLTTLILLHRLARARF